MTENFQSLVAVSPDELPVVVTSEKLLAHVLVGNLKNLHQSKAQVKSRGEVQGGGRKPWRQKGTGRARVGSRRTPLWRGGGVIFGPSTAHNLHIKVNKQESQKALRAIVADKSRKNEVFAIKLEKTLVKTKEALLILGELLGRGSILVVLDGKNKTSARAFKNLSQVTVVTSGSLSPLLAAQYRFLVLGPEALNKIKRYG
jgi:large subunit ribosomal protein L4